MISVIIPALNEAIGIEDTIADCRQRGFTDVVVADGGSEDRTIELARGAGALVISAPKGRANQMNAGAAAASGDALFFVHADSQLPQEARSLIEHTLSDDRVQAGCFRLAFDDDHPILRVNEWFTRFETAWTTFGDQGYFMRRSAFDACGGFPAQPLMEDVEMRRRLKRIGKFVKVSDSIQTSARRFRRRGVLRQQFLNGALLAAYFAGASAESLAEHYR